MLDWQHPTFRQAWENSDTLSGFLDQLYLTDRPVWQVDELGRYLGETRDLTEEDDRALWELYTSFLR